MMAWIKPLDLLYGDKRVSQITLFLVKHKHKPLLTQERSKQPSDISMAFPSNW